MNTQGAGHPAPFNAARPQEGVMRAISIDVVGGPSGKNGFRTGFWTVTLEDNSTIRFYASVPHQISLSEQEEMVVGKYNAEYNAAGRVS